MQLVAFFDFMLAFIHTIYCGNVHIINIGDPKYLAVLSRFDAQGVLISESVREVIDASNYEPSLGGCVGGMRQKFIFLFFKA